MLVTLPATSTAFYYLCAVTAAMFRFLLRIHSYHIISLPCIVPPRTEYIAAVGVDTISLYIIDRFSTTAQVITLPESLRPSAVSFDPVDSYFYYTDVQEKIIGRVQHSDVTQFDIIIRDGIESELLNISGEMNCFHINRCIRKKRGLENDVD